MISRAKILLSVATLVALLTAQVMGIARGFWCECLGAPAPVASVECRPLECHPAMNHGVCCPDGGISSCTEGGGNSDDGQRSLPEGSKHAHKFLTQEADFQGFTPVALPVPLFVVETYAGMPPVTWLEDVPVDCAEIPPTRRDGWRSPPQMAVTVLRTQVLLV